jgi:molybdopterin converting factor subunit 1
VAESEASVRVHVQYFAAARELAGVAEEEADFARELDVGSFRRWLATHKPRLAPYLPRMRVAVNGDFATDETAIRDGADVVLLPPVAGGSILAEVRSAPLSVDEVVAAVRVPSAGGIAVFLGVVRDHHAGKPVARLDYEAYVPLANKELARILDALMVAQPGTRVAALHRVGELAIGDTAVVVAASAAHRDQAFALCRLAIDSIKQSVPIWKKEWSPDGSALWVNLEEDERK